MELTLRDGRVLSFDKYGDPSGLPVFYFHGLPSCRLEAAWCGEAVRRSGVSLIAFDRPGFGRSSFRKYYPLVGLAEDVVELADHLGIKSFSVVGASAGGPFALAVAASLTDRVSAAATVGGFAPVGKGVSMTQMNRELRASLKIAQLAPWMLPSLFALTARAVGRRGSGFVRGLIKRAPAPDRELLRNEIVQTQLLNTFREAFALGPSGAAWEQRLLVGDWGFSLDELRIPVTVWQGSLDRNVPPEMGRSLASSIPGARLRLLDGEGHLSLVHNHFEEVLRDLVLPL